MTAKDTMAPEPTETIRVTVLCPKDLHTRLWQHRVGSPTGRKITISSFFVDAAEQLLAATEQTRKAKPGRRRQRRTRR